MKIIFFYKDYNIYSFLTKIFTKSRCYHCGFLDEESGLVYDMFMDRRRRKLSISKVFCTIDTPVDVSREYLEDKLTQDESSYGVVDYVLFGLRPLYHLIGKTTRNHAGVICSEMVYNDLIANGWTERFPEVPSPADLENKFFGFVDYFYSRHDA